MSHNRVLSQPLPQLNDRGGRLASTSARGARSQAFKPPAQVAAELRRRTRRENRRHDSVFSFMSGQLVVPPRNDSRDTRGTGRQALLPAIPPSPTASTTKKVTSVAKAGLSVPKTMIAIIKCAIGAGSFALPAAVKEAGLVAGLVGMLGLGALSSYTLELLVSCEQETMRRVQEEAEEDMESLLDDSVDTADAQSPVLIQSVNGVTPPQSPKTGNTPTSRGRTPMDGVRLTYPDVARIEFEDFELMLGPVRINIMELLVYLGICLVSLGACAAYIAFITSNMPDVIKWLTPLRTGLCMAPICIALALLRDFSVLAFTSILGDVAVTVGLIAMIVYAGDHSTHGFDIHRPAFTTFPDFFTFLGSASFLFSIHLILLPLIQAMQDRSKFKQTIHGSYVMITILNTVFAVLCYIYLGDTVQANVLKNMNPKSGLSKPVKVLLAIDLQFTYPMVLAACREVVEEGILNTTKTSWVETTRNAVRILLVGITFLIVVTVPGFGNIVSLTGGFACTMMAFVIPPLIHIRQQYRLGKLSPVSGAAHGLIVVFGLAIMIVSTAHTIKQIIKQHHHHK